MVDRTDRQFHYDQPGSAKLLGDKFQLMYAHAYVHGQVKKRRVEGRGLGGFGGGSA